MYICTPDEFVSMCWGVRKRGGGRESDVDCLSFVYLGSLKKVCPNGT